MCPDEVVVVVEEGRVADGGVVLLGEGDEVDVLEEEVAEAARALGDGDHERWRGYLSGWRWGPPGSLEAPTGARL